MTSVSHATAMYATKRRRRNSKNVRTVCNKDSHSKSNPSKRHRERLNQELDTLASLLPFEQSVLSKLDKLSILRLSVSYLRTKSYFQAALSSARMLGQHWTSNNLSINNNNHNHNLNSTNGSHAFGVIGQHAQLDQAPPQERQHYPPELRIEGDLIVQALNGFLLILTCDGEVFYTSHTVETYLGFHQSDICHQSVYELVHSEDREELMEQLKWDSQIQPKLAANANPNNSNNNSNPSDRLKGQHQPTLSSILASADQRHLLERNFTVRFRCLLDNTSGFLRLDIRGRIKVLHGQQNPQNLANSATNNQSATSANKKANFDPSAQSQATSEPMLAFFGVCIPFGPPSLLEMPSKDSVFKSKHRLDMSFISMDSRGRQMLGLQDLSNPAVRRGYQGQQQPASPASSSPTSPPKLIKLEAQTQKPASSAGKAIPNSGGNEARLSGSSVAGTGASTTGAGQQTSARQQWISAYDLVHQDDLSYMASAHQELLKTGASGLIAYRMVVQEPIGEAGSSAGSPRSMLDQQRDTTIGAYQWLQTSAKLYYKNSKPDFILCTHRPLMEEEGRDLLGKRTMDFKVTYLDVGLSPINDRILACDKFSSLQSLGGSGQPTGANNYMSNAGSGSPGCGTGRATHMVSSSPMSSGDGSSRSLASLSPQSTIMADDGMGTQTKARRVNYDLSVCQQRAAQQTTLDQYEQQAHYKKTSAADAYYDLDVQQQPEAELVDEQSVRRATKKKVAIKGNTVKQPSLAGTKRRDTSSADSGKRSKGVAQAGGVEYSAAQQGPNYQLGSAHSQQQQGYHAHHHHQQQQLHLYGQYHQHHNHSQDPAAVAGTTASNAAAAVAYPAIQAAAAYAASLGHHAHHGTHPTLHSYGSAAAYTPSQGQQGQSMGANGAQSLYGASSGATNYMHPHQQLHHHHAHHHLHDSTSAYHVHHHAHQGAYGSAGSAAFLPTEQLLQHYSQTAARSAALAAWPASAISSSDYQADGQQLAYGDLVRSRDSYSPNGGQQAASDGEVYGSQRTDQYQHQHQQLVNGSSLSATASSPTTDAIQKTVRSYTCLGDTNQHLYQQQQQQQQQQQSQQQQVQSQQLGPSSLASDGSVHRSPLSSGDSSNGSGSLATANAVASATATTDPLSSLNPASAYYLDSSGQQQGQMQQSQSHGYQASQQLAGYHQSSYRGHHYSSGATDSAVQGYSLASGQPSYQSHHHLSHAHHNLSAGHHHGQHEDLRISQRQQDSASAAAAAAVAASSYFHQANGAETNNIQHPGAMAAVKLYGANGKLRTVAM